MKGQILQQIFKLDAFRAKRKLTVGQEGPKLIILLFHVLFKDQLERETANLFPHEGILTEQFKELVDYFLTSGYTFIHPDQLDSLSPQGNYAMLTFDDGYFNNHRALPILQSFEVPAVFAIATDFILNHRAFWWDVHYRISLQKGKSWKTMLNEQNSLKSLHFSKVEQAISTNRKDFNPKSDLDRPFTAAELADFANESFVHLANHTRHHAILPYYTEEEISQEILSCHTDLKEITGKEYPYIAYPNGEGNDTVAKIAEANGMETGLTLTRQNNSLPLKDIFLLDRQQIFGQRPIKPQVDIIRASNSIAAWFRRRN